MKCPRSHCQNEAIVSKQYGVLPCQSCSDEDSIPLVKSPMFYSKAQQERIQRGWDTNEKDTLQPYMGNKINPDFFKAYPGQIENYPDAKEVLKKL